MLTEDFLIVDNFLHPFPNILRIIGVSLFSVTRKRADIFFVDSYLY